jgi:hypothetical protein
LRADAGAQEARTNTERTELCHHLAPLRVAAREAGQLVRECLQAQALRADPPDLRDGGRARRAQLHFSAVRLECESAHTCVAVG